jgi:hypothetical protein
MRLRSLPSIFAKDLATVMQHLQSMKQAADQGPGIAQRTEKSMQVLLPRQVYIPLYLNVFVPYTRCFILSWITLLTSDSFEPPWHTHPWP